MNRRLIFVAAAALALSGCSARLSSFGGGTSTPFIITSTLPPTPVPSETLTPIPPTATSTVAPIEGMTTTQLNVRGEPSSTGPQLGILAPFVKVQIVGRDADGKWFEIMYPQGPGGLAWIVAEYINVRNKDAIPVSGSVAVTPEPEQATSTPAGGGTILQQVNVRKGPGTDFEAVGTLNTNDTADLTGRDSSGSWIQIQFAEAPGGKGWIAAAYVKTTGADTLPIIGGNSETAAAGTPSPSAMSPSPTAGVASRDNDSAQSPAASAVFSPAGSRSLIYASDLSAPEGDAQDFIAFTPYSAQVLVSLSCSGNSKLVVGIELGGADVPEAARLGCGGSLLLAVSPVQRYLMELSIAGAGNSQVWVQYTIRVEDTG